MKSTVPLPPKKCVYCQCEFAPRSPKHITCGPVCRNKKDKRAERKGKRAKVRKWHARKTAKMLKSNGDRIVEAFGCSAKGLKRWIESKMKPDMTWANYGGTGYDLGRWHIDHKVPLAKFDFEDPAQVRAAFHYTNIQPMWSMANVVKGDS